MTESPTRFFLLKACGWAVVVLLVSLFQSVFLDEPIEYLVPTLWLAAGVYLGWLSPESPQSNRRWLKKGIGTGFIVVSLAAAWPGKPEAEMKWQPFSENSLAEAKRAGKPVIIDVYASWCVPCLKLDRAVFGRARIVEAASRFVTLRADVSDQHSLTNQQIMSKYGVEAIPTVIFIGTNGDECTAQRVVGYVSATEMSRRIDGCR